MSIQHWPQDERPREKLLRFGASHLSDSELLAIFLRVGIPGKSAVDLARELLLQFGSLKKLMLANADTFCQQPGMGVAKYAQLQAALEISTRYFRDELHEQTVIDNPASCKQFVRQALANRQTETFACLYLDTRHHIIAFEELFEGTIDSASVYPREVVRKVIEQKASAVILCHNHPSGSPDPSQADIQITHRLQEALSLIDVRILDHLIVAHHRITSLAELGLLH